MHRTKAKVALAVIAPLILVSVVTLTSGVASAKKAKAPTISCNDLTGTITWTPGLVPGTATEPTTQIAFKDLTVTKCTATGTESGVTQATSVTATASLTTHGNSCEALTTPVGKPTLYTFTIVWNDNGGTSTITFKGSHTLTGPPGPGFQLTPGKSTGAFPTKKASALAVPNISGLVDVSNCIADKGTGISTITIVSGSFSA